MVAVAYRAMHYIGNMRLLFRKTAMKLFTAKLAPIFTCGLEQIWEHLTENDLATLETVKATYLKRTLF
jgi:hypothetical protein